MKKKILIIAFLCMIALGAMIISDKIYKSTDMTGNVLEDNLIPEYSAKKLYLSMEINRFGQQRNIRQNRLKFIAN